MFRTKYLIAAAGIAALALSGCDMLKGSGDSEPAVTKKAPPAPAKKSADIFDEFYMDDVKKAPAQAAKGTGAQTGKAEPARQQQAQAPRGGSFSGNFNPNGSYVVQVNSTASSGGADKLAAKLKGMGYPAYVAEVQNPTPELTGTYYRVRIGGFDGIAEAKHFAETALVAAGYEYWVDRKSNDNVGIRGGGFGSGGYGQQNQYQAPAPVKYTPPPPPPPPPPAPAYAPPPKPAPIQQYTSPPPPPPAPAPAPVQYNMSPPPATAAPPAPPPPPPPNLPPPPPPSDWGTEDWGSGDW